MRNKVIVLALSVIMVLCSSFSVFASTVVSLDMTEPSCSDTQGYLVTADESLKNINVFYWSINPYVANGELNMGTLPSMNIVLNDDSMTLTALYSGTARMTLTRVHNSSTQWVLKSANFNNSSTYEYSFTNNAKYYCYNGNIGMVDDNLTSTANYLSVNWGHDASYQDEFDKLIDLLESLDKSNDNLYDKAISINSNLSSLNDNVQTSNTHLSNIADSTSEMYFVLEDVLSELTMILDVTDSIDGKIDGVISRLDDLMSGVADANSTLENISSQLDEFLASQGSEDTSTLDDSSLQQNEMYGDALLNNEASDEAFGALDNLNDSLDSTLNMEGLQPLWEWVSRAVFSHDKILLLFFFCLTMGVIKLIFNR